MLFAAHPCAPDCKLRLQLLDIKGCKRMRTLPTSLLNTPPTFLISFDAKQFSGTYGSMHENLESLKGALRRQDVVCSLLCDRDARRQSLETVSIVAVLLATAAFLAFSQAPQLPELFAEAQVVGFDMADIPEPSIEWLRRYYCAVALTFVLSMAVVVFITVLSIPQVRSWTASQPSVSAMTRWHHQARTARLRGAAWLLVQGGQSRAHLCALSSGLSQHHQHGHVHYQECAMYTWCAGVAPALTRAVPLCTPFKVDLCHLRPPVLCGCALSGCKAAHVCHWAGYTVLWACIQMRVCVPCVALPGDVWNSLLCMHIPW